MTFPLLGSSLFLSASYSRLFILNLQHSFPQILPFHHPEETANTILDSFGQVDNALKRAIGNPFRDLFSSFL